MEIRNASDISCQLLFLLKSPHIKDGSTQHGLGLLFLKDPKSYSFYRYWKSFILKVFSGTASEVVPGSMTTPNLNQNSIWYFIFFLHQISV